MHKVANEFKEELFDMIAEGRVEEAAELINDINKVLVVSNQVMKNINILLEATV